MPDISVPNIPSRHDFLCGHIAEFDEEGISTTLWQECPELPNYHLRQHNHTTGHRIFWYAYHDMNEAVASFLRITHGHPPLPPAIDLEATKALQPQENPHAT